MRSDTARLADFMCFTVYSTNLAYSQVYRPVLEQLGLTYPQYITIITLSEKDGQSIKSLSEKLFLEPSTITPMVKRLEAMGYVTRTRDIHDERSVLVSLTEEGRLLREKGLGFGAKTVAASGLSADEFRMLQKAIAKLRDNLITSAEQG
ncbi:MarR family transcriptional regulator [uncultured Thalassospira sp.]|uniref:MarR family winged helix-turn-helix transcriptional regulator n=1 Tax=uncultured Thalassospira sp. TaxID=404382 RepID=UPI0030DB9975